MPQDPNIADTLAYIYIKKNLPDNALSILDGLVSKYPSMVIWRYHLALAYFQSGQMAKAREHLQTALQHSPSSDETSKIHDLLAQTGA
jgi:predicted Zn-dependent protease